MPFGAIFGALFYALLALWLLAAGDAGVSFPGVARFGLALVAVGLAGGLLFRLAWARWAGAAMAVVLAVLVLFVGGFHGAVVNLVVLFGAVLVVALLLIPATGTLRHAGEEPDRSPTHAARVLAGALVLGLVGLAVGLGWGTGHAGKPGTSGQSAAVDERTQQATRVSWADFGAGLEQARAESKPMLVSFETAWCGYCRKMDRETWKHPEVIDRLGEIVAVRVDAEETRQRNGFVGRDLAARYNVNGYPSILLIDTDGKVVNRTGGYQPPRQFLSWLEQSLRRVGYEAAGSDSLSVSGI